MISIGSDLIDIRRIEKTLNRFGNKFKNRIFTQKEIEKWIFANSALCIIDVPNHFKNFKSVFKFKLL